MSVEQESVFPKFTEKFLDEHVDMEYICQSDYSWKEAPASAVLLAVEILKLLYSTGLYHTSVGTMAMGVFSSTAIGRAKSLPLIHGSGKRCTSATIPIGIGSPGNPTTRRMGFHCEIQERDDHRLSDASLTHIRSHTVEAVVIVGIGSGLAYAPIDADDLPGDFKTSGAMDACPCFQWCLHWPAFPR